MRAVWPIPYVRLNLYRDPTPLIPTIRPLSAEIEPFHRRRAREIRWLRTGLLAGAWTVAIILAVAFVRRDALKYLNWSEAVYQRFWPSRLLLAAHVAGAGIALLVGPLQFSRRLRSRWPRVHRTIGWTYVIAVLVSTPFAIRLAPYSGCLECIPPFLIWGVLTLTVTLIAVVLAVLQSHAMHREFMVRSYALMFAFVFVRLDHHLVGTTLEVPLPAGVARPALVMWLAWLVPLLLVELVVSWMPTVRRAYSRPRRRSS